MAEALGLFPDFAPESLVFRFAALEQNELLEVSGTRHLL